jgi:putative hydrolase of the HAD superfamily
MERRIEHVFWDATNTLLRVRGSVGQIYAELAQHHGLTADAAEIDRRFPDCIAAIPQVLHPGMSKEEIEEVERGWWSRVARDVLAPFGPFPHFDAFFDDVFETFRGRDAWELMPGAQEAIEALQRQDRCLGIISDMDSRLFDVLEAFGLQRVFDVVCLSFQCGFQKPDRRLFEIALDRSGAQASSSAHLGDSPRSDVQGALGAGMIAIHFDPEHLGNTPPGAHVIRELTKFPEFLSHLDGRH